MTNRKVRVAHESRMPGKKGSLRRLVAALLLTAAAALAAVCLTACTAANLSTDTSTEANITKLHRASLLTEREAEEENPLNPDSTLSVPTDVKKTGEIWFIVDCYHDRIIYHENLEDPLTSWRVMTDEISRGHTVASDGIVYLADDTEQNRVLIFEQEDGAFVMTQVFEEIGDRPHEILYREEDKTFYCWSSESGEMFLFRRDDADDRVYLEEIRRIPLLAGTYVRSFTVTDRAGEDEIWFVSGTPTSAGYAENYAPSVVVCDLDTFSVKETWPVADEMAGMVQITPIDGWLYVTISTDSTGDQGAADLIRARTPQDLAEGSVEHLYREYFEGGGTPYIIRRIEDCWYLAEHRANRDAVWSFSADDGGIRDAKRLYPQE